MYFKIRAAEPGSSKKIIYIVQGKDEIKDAYLQEVWDDQDEYEMVGLEAEYDKSEKRNFPRSYTDIPLLPERSSVVEVFDAGYRFTFERWKGLGRWGFESFDPKSHEKETRYNELFNKGIVSIKSHTFHKFERMLNSLDYDQDLKLIKGNRAVTARIYLSYDTEKYQGGDYIECCVSPNMAIFNFVAALGEGFLPHRFGLTQILYDGPGGMGKHFGREVYKSSVEVKEWDLGFDNTVSLLASVE